MSRTSPVRPVISHVGARPKTGATRVVGIPGGRVTGAATQALTVGQDRFSIFDVLAPVVVDLAQFEVTTGPASAANTRILLARADSSYQPASALFDVEIAVASGFTGVKSHAPSVTLAPGPYCSAINVDVAMTVRRWNTGTGWAMPTMGSTAQFGFMTLSRAYAAFGATPAAWDTPDTGVSAPIQSIILFGWDAA